MARVAWLLAGLFVGLPLLAPAAAATPPPSCCFTKAIEGYAVYDPQDTCDPTVKPGTDKLRDLLLATYPGTRDLGIVRSCSIGGTSEHKEGRAFDWGVRVDRPAEKAMADEFTAWLLKDLADGADAMARRMGIMYMIWNGRIWGSYRASEGWRTYTGSNPHTDHVHFSLSWDGAMARTSYWCCRYNPAPSDTARPETTPTLTGTRGDNGWWVSPVAIKLSATDTGGSGVDFTKYRVDLGAWRTYAGPFTLSADGTRRVDYYSVDKAGNQEATETIDVRIDEVAPGTTSLLGGTQGDEGWWRSAVTVTLRATDATSGVASTTAWRDGAGFTYRGPFAVAGEGSHTVSYRSRDVAGNVEATDSVALRIDTVAPVTTMRMSGPSHQGTHLYVSEATGFALSAGDATSGVRTTTWTWRGATQGYAGPFWLPGADGPGTLAWRSEDRAGNVEASRSQELFLDTTPPSVSFASPPEGALLASLDPVPVKADASDAGSGVARVEFLVDGILRAIDSLAPFEWAWPVGDEALGDHVLTVRAVDHLGHAAGAQRKVGTVPTSAKGAQASLARAQGVAQGGAGELAALAQGLPQQPPSPGAAQGALARVGERALVLVPDAPPLPAPPATGGIPGQAQQAAQQLADSLGSPPRLPVVGVVAEADPASGSYRLGVTLDGAFHGLEGELPG